MFLEIRCLEFAGIWVGEKAVAQARTTIVPGSVREYNKVPPTTEKL